MHACMHTIPYHTLPDLTWYDIVWHDIACVHTCTCILRIRTCTYVHIRVHRHAHAHTHTHSAIPTYIPTYIRTDIQTCRHTCKHTYIHTYIHAYIHTLQNCIYTYIYTPALKSVYLLTAWSLYTLLWIYLDSFSPQWTAPGPRAPRGGHLYKGFLFKWVYRGYFWGSIRVLWNRVWGSFKGSLKGSKRYRWGYYSIGALIITIRFWDVLGHSTLQPIAKERNS